MLVKSIHRNARISASKAREVTREIQGLPATDALDLLRFVPKKAADLVRKTLATAVANAENNNELDPSTLVVKEAVVGEAGTMKRYVPKARGSAGPILKRSSHIRIILTDEVEIKRREKSPAKKSKKPAAKKPTAQKPKSDKPAAGKEAAPANPPVAEAAPAEESKK